MASDASDDRDAELADLTGSELVARLSTTCRRADYEAVARVLDARDRRLAEAEAALAEFRPALAAALAELDDLREKYLALGPMSDAAVRPVAPAPAPRGERRAEEPREKGGNFIDLCSSDDEEEEWEEGEFRPHVAGFSRKRKAPASACSSDDDEDEDDRIPLSQLLKKQRGAEAAADGEPKKGNGDAQANSIRAMGGDLPGISPVIREGAEGRAGQRAGVPKMATFLQGRGNGESGKDGGMSKATPSPQPTGSAAGNISQKANSVRPLGNDLPQTPPVIRERPEARVGAPEKPKVAAFVQGRGNSDSPEIGGVSWAMPSSPPPGFAIRTDSQKNFSKADGDGATIAGNQGSFAGPDEDTPSQVRTPTLTARKIVGSARAGTKTPNEHIGSAADGTCSTVWRAISEQEKTNSGVHKAKVLLETNGIGEQGSISMVLGTIREKEKANGRVHKTKLLPGTDGIGEQGGKLSSCQSREVSDGGRVRTSDKLVSAALQPNSELSLHSGSGQTSVEGQLPSAVTKHWDSDAHVFTSCLENKEICMQAACALYRQGKLTFRPTGGGLSKGDADRAAELAEFLLDGNLQGPLKRTTEELMKHDPEAHNLLEKVVLRCSEQLLYLQEHNGSILPLKVIKSIL